MGGVTRVIRPDDDEWPPELNELGPHRPPERLFAAGLPLARAAAAIAVVGTRRPTAAGMEAARHIAEGLAEAGLVVVSGLAVGIDAAAHRGALHAGGHTVAVLGCGLDVPYPRRNAGLKQEVEACGTLLSEYADGTPPEKHNFPMRNRIIAGLAAGVVVVEGGLTSGALVTARLALDANRGVYAVPGSTRNPMAAGPNELIRRNQALLVTSVDDVFEDLAPQLVSSRRDGGGNQVALSDEEQAVLRCLDDVPATHDVLAAACDLARGRLAVALATLEIKALAVRLRGGYCITDAGTRALACVSH